MIEPVFAPVLFMQTVLLIILKFRGLNLGRQFSYITLVLCLISLQQPLYRGPKLTISKIKKEITQ